MHDAVRESSVRRVELWLAPLLLESTVFPIKHVAWNHRCYPGLLGAGLAFGLVAVRLPRILPAAALLLLGCLTIAEGRAWADPEGLGRRDVRTAPRVPYLWGSEGRSALGSGRPAGAERMFRQALRPAWKEEGAELMIAPCLALEGRPEEAVRFLQERRGKLGGDPRYRGYLARAFYDLGLLGLRKGDLASAEVAFRKALEAAPDYEPARRKLAVVLERRGK